MEITRALPAVEESLAISREIGHDAGIARALAELGIVIFYRGDYARTSAVLEEGPTAAWRAGQPPLNTLQALNRLGVAAHLAGDLDRARVLLDQGPALARGVKSKRHLGWALGDLGELLVPLGDYANARPLLEEGVVVTCEVGDQLGMAQRLLDLGNLLRIQNEHSQEEELLNEARERFEHLGSAHGLSLGRATLANLERREGRYERAHGLLAESLKTKMTVQDERAISHRVWLFGVLEIAHGAHARGTCLICAGMADGLYQTLLSPFDRAEAEDALDLARPALSEETSTHAWAEGQTMTLEDAVKLALSTWDSVQRGQESCAERLRPRDKWSHGFESCHRPFSRWPSLRDDYNAFAPGGFFWPRD